MTGHRVQAENGPWIRQLLQPTVNTVMVLRANAETGAQLLRSLGVNAWLNPRFKLSQSQMGLECLRTASDIASFIHPDWL